MSAPQQSGPHQPTATPNGPLPERPVLDLREMAASQLPALGLLSQMGYTYLPPAEALAQRGGARGQPILREVLLGALSRINRVTYKGAQREFTAEGLQAAADKLLHLPFTSQVETAEKAYDLLTLGASVEQVIDGDRKSFSVRFIDWDTPENNAWHVTEEYVLERESSRATRRPDVVVFCNGIPLAVIECKRPDLGVEQAISQHMRNQKPHEIPRLFAFAQLLLAVAQNAGQYATGGTPPRYWAHWREEESAVTAGMEAAVQARLDEGTRAQILGWHPEPEQATLAAGWRDGNRLPSEQDRLIYSLLLPERLLELVRGFVLFDAGTKKVARYQQFFAVQRMLERLQERRSQGAAGGEGRRGGVVWHTTGSGKSLTMVMLARALFRLPDLHAPKVVLVTDRVDLDAQISRTFAHTGADVARASSGNHLRELLTAGRSQVITTIIDKFETVQAAGFRDPSDEIFVLVDESHRSQYGAIHAMMRDVLPHACYIGFTGTPLLKRERSTAQKFGGIVHAYPMQQAVNDGAVAPLKYEARYAELTGAGAQLDRWFDRVTEGLDETEKAEVKRQFNLGKAVLGADSRLEEIAYDIGRHFAANYADTGMGAQLAVSSKADGVRYLRAFQRWHKLEAALVISPPDTREGHDSTEAGRTPEVQAFWADMMAKYGSPAQYQSRIIEAFQAGDIDLLIVVDKLLTGFDAPRNAVLYLDKRLREHSILQAIARVNRLYDGKDYGLVVDYRGIFTELSEANAMYEALAAEGFDETDVVGVLENVEEEIALLPTRHSHVWDLFAGVDFGDSEAVQRFLGPEDVREDFYERLRTFAKTLQLALATASFYQSSSPKRREQYLSDLKQFLKLRATVATRYSDDPDYGPYHRQLEALIREHIGTEGVQQLREPAPIFDGQRLEADLCGLEGAARADAIASRVQRAITERLETDPTYYQRLSELVSGLIADHRAERISDLEYLRRTEEIADEVRGRAEGAGTGDPRLEGQREATAYWGLLRAELGEALAGEDDPDLVPLALAFAEAMEREKVRDWFGSDSVKRRMRLALYDAVDDAALAQGWKVYIPKATHESLQDKVLSVTHHQDTV